MSIHSRHKERDVNNNTRKTQGELFQSTLSIKRETCGKVMLPSASGFQSTLSIKRETMIIKNIPRVDLFQSTLSIKRETVDDSQCRAWQRISIHSLHKERDRSWRRVQSGMQISIHSLHKERDPNSDRYKFSLYPHFNPLSP